MKRMCYLAYKIISKIPDALSGKILPVAEHMIEDLLYRIQSNVDVTSAEEAIAQLPAEYRVVLELHYEWGLSRREIAALLEWSWALSRPASCARRQIAALLGWSGGKVSQRLTRAISLLKYELHPEAFQKAQGLLNRPM